MKIKQEWNLLKEESNDSSFGLNVSLNNNYSIVNDYAIKEGNDIHYIDEEEVSNIIDSISPDFLTVYSGTDFPDKAPIDSIFIKDCDSLYVKTENEFPQWSLLSTISSEPKVEYLRPELAICECCGAPLRGNRCEYCGSTYIWR